MRTIESDLQQIELLKNTTEETLQKIEAKWQESKELVSYIAKGTIDGHYASQTKKEESTANWWIGFSIFSTTIAIIWLGCVIYNGITLCDNIMMDKYKFLLYFIPRGSMTLCILGLATYFGQQAAYHRKNANFLRTRAFALQAISPFLDDIGKEKAESLLTSKQKIVEHLLKDFDK